jgi:hypothetical protein
MAQIRKKILVGLLLISGAMVALCVVVLYLNFHPKRTYEIPGSNRLFAQAIDSADETLHVKVADWPYTFWQPVLLGDAAWPERHSVARFFRSKDGSIVALLAQERNASEALYVTAYDFKNHEKFEARDSDGGACGNNAKVIELLKERGGPEESPIEIPPLNSGLYDK